MKLDRTRFLIFGGNPLRWVGYDHTRGDEDIRHPGKVFVQASVVAFTPHALGNLAVIIYTGNLSNQARYVAVVKAPRHSSNATGQKVLGDLPERMAAGFLAKRFR